MNADVSLKLAQIKTQGFSQMFIVADFDRTITKAYKHNKDVPTGLSIFHNGDFLRPNYAQKAQELWNYYYPRETRTDLDDQTKSALMQEWYEKHISLFVEYELNKSIINRAATSDKILLREDTDKLIEHCAQKNVPFFVFSAGSGDVIKELFLHKQLLKPTVNICSNYFAFDKQEKVTGFSSQIIHSYNKNSINLYEHGIHEHVLDKQNLVLIGDSLKDTQMGEHFHPENILRIGFCHDVTRLSDFRETFDVVITGDGSFQPVIKLLQF